MTGARVRVDGAIDLKLLPIPSLALKGVHVASSQGDGPVLDVASVRLELAAASMLRGELRFTDADLVRPQLKWLADMLEDGRPYLLGASPCIADFAAVHVVWFLRGRKIDCSAALDAWPKLIAWRDRMLRVGHGTRTNIAADVALAEARAATPAPPRASDPQDGDPRPGEQARVRANDNARDWIEGEVSYIDAHEIALLRSDPDVGEVAVHFPRLGYDWRRQRA